MTAPRRTTGHVPPWSEEAERAVLGAMLLNQQAREVGLNLVTVADFYSPQHATVFAAIGSLVARGSAVDVVTVADVLAVSGDLELMHGYEQRDTLSGLRSLSAAAPTSWNIRSYAAIVAEDGACRRGIELAGAIADAGYHGDLAMVEALIGEGHERLAAPLGDVDAPTEASVLARREFPHRWVVEGLLERLDVGAIVGMEGFGKAARLDLPVVTPAGFTPLGEIKVGATVFGLNGQPCRVDWVGPAHVPERAYRLRFDSGEEIDASGDHRWLTVDYHARQRDHELAMVTTDEIAATLHARGGHTVNHAIPCASPIDSPEADLPWPPYTLGVWLGDGTTKDPSITINLRDAPQILGAMTEEGTRWRVREGASRSRPSCKTVGLLGCRATMRSMNLLGNKHIPAQYLRASFKQRLALLQGIMDTDGYVVPKGAGKGRGRGAAGCDITLTCERLAADTLALLRSLGVKASMGEGRAKLNGEDYGPKWRVTFQTDLPVAIVDYKASRLTPLRTRRARYRYIVGCDPIRPVPMCCIGVDSPDHTFLVTDSFIATHNSLSLRQWSVQFASGVHPFTLAAIDPVRVLIVDCENSEAQVSRSLQWLLRIAGDRYAGCLWVETRSQGMDLTGARDARWLEAKVAAVRPDVLVLGPLYKMYRGSPGQSKHSEEAAEHVTNVIDEIKVRYDLAVLIEAHAPWAQGATGREFRIRGSAAWTGWAGFSLALVPVKRVDGRREVRVTRPVRGDRDTGRAWPSELVQGEEWPWEVPGAKRASVEAPRLGEEPF